MTDRREVVSAFLDDEPFDAGELARALADTDGRALLLDLVALRSLVQPAAAPLTIATLPPQSSAGRSRHTLRWLQDRARRPPSAARDRRSDRPRDRSRRHRPIGTTRPRRRA